MMMKMTEREWSSYCCLMPVRSRKTPHKSQATACLYR